MKAIWAVSMPLFPWATPAGSKVASLARPTSSGSRFNRKDDNLVGDSDRSPGATVGAVRRRRALERSRLFDQEAERYDRCRPGYPHAVIDELLGPGPDGLKVLDVGCGTGIASRLMAERGAKVLGVEVAPRMAEIARRQGTEVEVAAFEDWEPAGRRFDRVTSAQAWHWLDLPVATAKAASVLRPGGRPCLIWNAGSHPDDLSDALAEVYQRVLPSPVHAVFRGYAANRSTDRRSGLASEVAAIAAVPDFSAPTEKWFPWSHTYERDEWLEQLLPQRPRRARPSRPRAAVRRYRSGYR
jgi:SAM-dependent methyltransferase